MLEARKQEQMQQKEETTPVTVVDSSYEPPAVIFSDLIKEKIADATAYIQTQAALLKNKRERLHNQ